MKKVCIALRALFYKPQRAMDERGEKIIFYTMQCFFEKNNFSQIICKKKCLARIIHLSLMMSGFSCVYKKDGDVIKRMEFYKRASAFESEFFLTWVRYSDKAVLKGTRF